MSSENKLHKKLMQCFKESGLEGFEQSEIIAALLGFTVSEEELMEKSELLLRRLGNLSSVMDMSVEGLKRIGEISESSAIILNAIPGVLRRRYTDIIESRKLKLNVLENLGAYCTARYFGFTDEVLSMVMLDNEGGLIGHEVIQVGSRASASVNIEKIAQILYSYDAQNFVLIHNHPDGNMKPSESDVGTTDYITRYFTKLGKNLVEHLIVYQDKYMPIKLFTRMYGKDVFGKLYDYSVF